MILSFLRLLVLLVILLISDMQIFTSFSVMDFVCNCAIALGKITSYLVRQRSACFFISCPVANATMLISYVLPEEKITCCMHVIVSFSCGDTVSSNSYYLVHVL